MVQHSGSIGSQISNHGPQHNQIQNLQSKIKKKQSSKNYEQYVGHHGHGASSSLTSNKTVGKMPGKYAHLVKNQQNSQNRNRGPMLDNELGFDFQNADLALNNMGPATGQSIGGMANVPNNDLLFSSQGGSLQMLNVGGRPNLNSLKKQQMPGQAGAGNNFAMM